MSFADSSHRQTLARAFKELLPFCRAHVLPQVRPDDSRGYGINPDRRPHSGWVIAASVCGTIEALTRALAVELAPIRVNAVSPGVVRTNLWQNMSSSEREQLFESVGKRLPVGRVGEAHDIAKAYLFLMKEGFSTGQIIVVDGGTVLV
jgi:NAD(P)-dependent dehydrogenase (short-subunit alcohol dehydrogenase family)